MFRQETKLFCHQPMPMFFIKVFCIDNCHNEFLPLQPQQKSKQSSKRHRNHISPSSRPSSKSRQHLSSNLTNLGDILDDCLQSELSFLCVKIDWSLDVIQHIHAAAHILTIHPTTLYTEPSFHNIIKCLIVRSNGIYKLWKPQHAKNVCQHLQNW